MSGGMCKAWDGSETLSKGYGLAVIDGRYRVVAVDEWFSYTAYRTLRQRQQRLKRHGHCGRFDRCYR